MKTRFGVLAISAMLLASATMSAQSGNSQDESNPRGLDARRGYTQSDDSCTSLNDPGQNAGDDQLAQAQSPPRGPRWDSPHMSRPYPPSPFPYVPYGNPRHVAIGGLIGFGAGFALGAGANHTNTRVASGLIVGALGAVFGAAIGHGIATFPRASFRRRHRWSNNDEEDWASSAPSHAETAADAGQSPRQGN